MRILFIFYPIHIEYRQWFNIDIAYMHDLGQKFYENTLQRFTKDAN